MGATLTTGTGFGCSALAAADVWFVFSATITGEHVVATCTPPSFAQVTLFESSLQIYDVAAYPLSLICQEGGCSTAGSLGNPTFGTHSYAPVNFVAGQSYYIRVMSKNQGAIPTGDFYTAPIPVSGANTCTTAPVETTFSATAGSTYWLRLGASPACDDDDLNDEGPCPTYGPQNILFQARGAFARFDATAGATYLFRVGNNVTAPMQFQIEIRYGFSLVMSHDPVNATATVADLGGTAGDYVLNALTLNAGAFPNGWFYGVDVPLLELVSLVSAGPPFFVTLHAAGGYALTVGGVPPLGVTLYGVAAEFAPNGSFVRRSTPQFLAL